MAMVIAPNKEYTGVSASVGFVQGEGKTDNPHLIEWFKQHGYTVEGEGEKSGTEEDGDGVSKLTIEELIAYATEKGIDLGNATSQSGILKKIKEGEKNGTGADTNQG